MINGKIALACLIFLFLILIDYSAAQNIPENKAEYFDIKGPYLGQEPPGETPQLFAPQVISEAGYTLHGFPAVSADGREIYWPIIPPAIMFTRETENGWTKPEKAPFSQMAIQAVNFSPDGQRLYFQNSLPDGFGSLDIYYLDKTASGWSDPVNPGQPPNSPQVESQPSLTNNGDLYFTGTREGSGMDRGIYVSRQVEGVYQAPELLPRPINTDYIDAYPFISKYGDFLLFSSSRPGMEESDLKLYISFSMIDGSWSDPVDLNEKLNIKSPTRFGSISSDGKYMFFQSEGNIFWVDAGVVEKFRPEEKEPANYDKVQERVNKMEEQERYEAAIEFMKDKFEKFPENEYEIIKELTYLYIKTGEYEKCRNLWMRGHEKGIFFGLFKHIPYFKPFQEFAWFDSLSEHDLAMRKEAVEKSRTTYEIVLPSGYDKNKKYPLFLVLHGGGSTVNRAKTHWNSLKMEQEFIVAYIQSYLHYGLKEFGWAQKDPRAREEIKACFDEIVAKYPIDFTRIIIGGISAGGSAGMDFAVNQIIPATGCLAVCPALDIDEFAQEEIESAQKAGLACYIITGEDDFSLEGQRKTAANLSRAGVKIGFVIIPGMGHEYPERFAEKIDKTLEFF